MGVGERSCGRGSVVMRKKENLMFQDDHDRGLVWDLGVMLERRRALGLLAGVAGGAVLAACRQGGPGGPPPMSDPESNVTGTAPDGETCIKLPQETNGPYPADGTNTKSGQTVNVLTQSGIQRSDIRASFGGVSGTAAGVPLELTITLVNVGGQCKPLAGYAIYVWHCDAAGKYSLYDLTDQNFLRGVQVTNTKGEVRFVTIVPGTYMGRYPHIHFEIFASAGKAASGKDSLLISQFAVPAEALKPIYAADKNYASSVKPLVANAGIANDNVFGDNTPEQIKAQTLALSGDATTGYKGSVTVGIKPA